MDRPIERQSLAGEWSFAEREGGSGPDEWTTGEVPGDVYHDLLRAGEIPDPFVGDDELDVQWVGETGWTYRRTFEVAAATLDHDEHRLVFEGIDTVADVTVNGEYVGSSDNMHRRHEFDVGDALVAGENRIEVAFESAVEYAARRADAYPYEVETTRYPVEQPHRNFVRKAQCHFGWDWGTCLPTMGIWKDVELVSFSEPRITDVAVGQDHDGDDVDLRVDLRLDVPADGDYEVAVAVADAETTEPVSLSAGIDHARVDLAVTDPDLWWPAGQGEQPLYDLTVDLSTTGGADGTGGEPVDSATERIGFREIELVREADDASEIEGTGESFGFEVNGRPVFAKGANWIPADGVPSRVDESDYRRLLGDAVEANMNAIRVWGGGIYEREPFYEVCDELGLLVWQDFTFACALYPADDAFVETVEAEARHQVRRLSSHPSIALWCGNNENEEMLREWIGEDHDEYDQWAEDYDAIFHDLLPDVVEDVDPDGRAYWPSSPSSSSPDRLPNDDAEGDVHFWDVWHSGDPFARYLESRPRFASEFGYQSFPSTETLEQVLEPGDMNPTAPLMEHHQRNPGGNGRILTRMTDHFRVPWSFDRFVYLSQVQQALAIRTAIEHWRRLKPHCMGTLYWQLNDMWQVASWSSIEYGGRWKALHHAARRFYAPVLVSIAPVDESGDPIARAEDADRYQVWLTSDVPHALDGDVSVSVTTFGGRTLLEEAVSPSIDELGSGVVATVDPDELRADPERVLLRAEYTGPEESSPAYEVLDVYKRLALPEDPIDVSVDGDEVTVSAESAALFVHLDQGTMAGVFSDDYFHVEAGEERTVTFERRPGEEETLADHLSATHLADRE